jgi:APA family basic amino acid/polyamine antiporter
VSWILINEQVGVLSLIVCVLKIESKDPGRVPFPKENKIIYKQKQKKKMGVMGVLGMVLAWCGTISRRTVQKAFLIRPRSVEAARESAGHGLKRSMSLFDLLMFGIGGCVGSGVFVLAGLVAHRYSGPGVVLSFLIASVSCLFSAGSYGELSCRIPSAGSSYAYAYECLGEFAAVMTAWCLFLEYGISGAAVARAWGEKLNDLISPEDVPFIMWDKEHGINIFAALLQISCVVILLCGVNAGKLVVNVFTLLKMVIIVFMIVAGFSVAKPVNLQPFVPFGMTGVIRGSTACIFSYVGYDEVLRTIRW